MKIIERKINDSWLKASIVGSIWASFEIVFGSFLHNIKFPMSGTILTIIAISIIISFSMKWYERGMILKAGIIAALMKSISPSAVLLGPMTGIFFEALLFELTLWILGRNYVSYTIAAILAVYSVLIHKIISLLIYYGFDIVRISENLYYFIIKQLHINNLNFVQALLLISIFYILAGIFAAVVGIIIGKKANKSEKQDINSSIDLKFKTDFFKINDNQKFNIVLLFSNLVIIILVFIVINKFNIVYSALAAFIYLFFVGTRYKNSLRHLKKTGFWIQIILVLLISAIFYNEINPQISLLNSEGLIAGSVMVIRMFILLAGFSAISYELRNPIVKVLLFRNGMGNLYMSLGVAFAILPKAIDENTNPRKLIKDSTGIFSKMLNIAENVYNFYKNEGIKRNAIIITGEKGQGKSTFLMNLNEQLRSKGIKTAGFIAEGKWQNGKRSGFDLIDISSDEKIKLASIEKISDFKVGKFYFNQQAFDFGEKSVMKNINKADIFIIDEIGHLELRNKGWSNIAEQIFKTNKTQIWAVRKSLIDDVISRFGLSKAYIFDISEDDTKEVMKIIDKKVAV